MEKMIMKGINFKQEAITKIDSDHSAIETAQGNRYTYDYLVVCPGV